MALKAMFLRLSKCSPVSTAMCLVLVLCAAAAAQTGPVRNLRQGQCPELIDLIKDLTPVVVSISIERHMLQKSSSEPPPLFRYGPYGPEERFRNRERFPLDSVGSGFFFDTEGNIITNSHVVEGASKILVTLSSGKTCQASVVAVHPRVDLAMIRIKPPHAVERARVGTAKTVQVGEYVLAMGNPYGLGKTVTFGIVSGKGRFIGLGPDDDFIQTDAAINPGNSGGPLFNMAGEVIGVNTAVIASGKGIGFSIPADYIADLTRSPSRLKEPERGWLGIYVEDMTEQQASLLGMAAPAGTFVDEVLDSTPASNAGLVKGDLILKADGEQVRNGRHLSRIVASTKPGELIRMTILRGKKTQTVDLIVGSSPE
jgi:serine protease Do